MNITLNYRKYKVYGLDWVLFFWLSPLFFGYIVGKILRKVKGGK